jgi:hypothetical protein
MRMREAAIKVRAPILLRTLTAAFKGWYTAVEEHKTRVVGAVQLLNPVDLTHSLQAPGFKPLSL